MQRWPPGGHHPAADGRHHSGRPHKRGWHHDSCLHRGRPTRLWLVNTSAGRRQGRGQRPASRGQWRVGAVAAQTGGGGSGGGAGRWGQWRRGRAVGVWHQGRCSRYGRILGYKRVSMKEGSRPASRQWHVSMRTTWALGASPPHPRARKENGWWWWPPAAWREAHDRLDLPWAHHLKNIVGLIEIFSSVHPSILAPPHLSLHVSPTRATAVPGRRVGGSGGGGGSRVGRSDCPVRA